MHPNKPERPSLLLHTCCGPCSTSVLERLADDFCVTLYFYNPNLDSEVEHTRRLAAQQAVSDRLGTELIISSYTPAAFKAVTTGLEAEPEGGVRCARCFALRLGETAKCAKEKDFDYFTTSLSVSPHKNADLLNEVGAQIGAQVDVAYLAADFKKQNGYRRSVALAKAFGLYRQNYCGCSHSLR